MKKFIFRFETLAVAAIGLFSGVFLVETYGYGRRAGLFPRLISEVVLFLILIFLVSRARRFWKNRGASGNVPAPAEAIAAAEPSAGMKWHLSFGLAGAFCLLLYLIGFGPATVCYLVAHIYLAGYRRRGVIAVYALAVTAVMVLMGYFFKIPLPDGVLVELLMPSF